jgi:hypothetical protein
MLSCAMGQAVSFWPLTVETWLHVWVSPYGICGGKVALGQVFLQVLQFSPISIIPPWLSILIYHLGDEQ